MKKVKLITSYGIVIMLDYFIKTNKIVFLFTCIAIKLQSNFIPNK